MHKSQVTLRTILESDIEGYLVSRVELAGGVCEKTVSPGKRGYFDRVLVLPGGRVVFAEVKKPRGSRTPLQQSRRHAAYRALGAEVVVVKSRADVDRLLGQGVQKSGADQV